MAAELLTPRELDFLWESFGEGELPYPLELRSHGDTVAERSILRKQTMNSLVTRRLADSSLNLEPIVEDWFGLLANSDASVDAVQLNDPNTYPLLAIAVAKGAKGLLAVQDGSGLHLRDIQPDGLASAIVGLLPVARRGSDKSITVPLERLIAGPGADFMQRRAHVADDSGTDTERQGVDDDRKALARLHAQSRRRGGQIGANARSRVGGKSRMPVLSWFDTETGRYLTQASEGDDGRYWITIAPADVPTLRSRLAEMLDRAAGANSAPL